MKKTYSISLKTIAGKSFKFDWCVNTNEVMKDTTVEDVFLALPYIVAKDDGARKLLIPQSSVDHIIMEEQE